MSWQGCLDLLFFYFSSSFFVPSFITLKFSLKHKHSLYSAKYHIQLVMFLPSIASSLCNDFFSIPNNARANYSMSYDFSCQAYQQSFLMVDFSYLSTLLPSLLKTRRAKYSKPSLVIILRFCIDIVYLRELYFVLNFYLILFWLYNIEELCWTAYFLSS